jgi:hypothetical protein
MKHAACRGKAPQNQGDPDPFFPERGESRVGNIGKTICFGCNVREQCEDYRQRTNSDYGIWAGKIQPRKKDKK